MDPVVYSTTCLSSSFYFVWLRQWTCINKFLLNIYCCDAQHLTTQWAEGGWVLQRKAGRQKILQGCPFYILNLHFFTLTCGTNTHPAALLGINQPVTWIKRSFYDFPTITLPILFLTNLNTNKKGLHC